MIRILFLALCIFSASLSYSQASLSHKQINKVYDNGIDLYKRNKFGRAQSEFAKTLDALQGKNDLRVADAAYYYALCSKQLGNANAEALLTVFVDDYPVSPRVPQANYHLGDLQFEKKRYSKALKYFNKVKDKHLTTEEKDGIHFKKAYCFFYEDDMDAALPYFSQLKKGSSQWKNASTYYYAHIQYQKENYETALKAFQSIENDPSYSKIVPFYTSQILYLTEQYNEALDRSLEMIKHAQGERKVDVARIAGECYFALKKYDKAIEYLELALAETSNPTREDYFHLGFAYYYTGNFQAAIKNLSMVTSEGDGMSQNAYYHLADCYLKLNQKERARVAFVAASKSAYDLQLKEEALFASIKLSYELSFSAFDEIIKQLFAFVNDFPNSEYIDQAYDLLGKAFLSTQNYEAALQALENVEHKTLGLYKALQVVSYYYAIDLYGQMQYEGAIKYFNYSLKYERYNNRVRLYAIYWRAESLYRMKRYEDAVVDYRAFIVTNGSFSYKEFALSHYNLAYAYFKLKNYTEAKNWWRKYIKLEKNKQAPMLADAYNRVGDCYFLERDFVQANSYYDQCIVLDKGMADYAHFQKGLGLGIQKKYTPKVQEMRYLEEKFPKSPLLPNALFEIGNSHVSNNESSSAIQAYKQVINQFPNTTWSKKSYLKLGLVYYNAGSLSDSKNYYKQVVDKYPATPEAQTALLGIQNIYLDENNVDAYMSYTKGLGTFAQVEVHEQDSLFYISAEKYYMQGNCKDAVHGLGRYLKKYPQGLYFVNANYYMADCLYQAGEYKKALNAYDEVIKIGNNIFFEDALYRSGEIRYDNEEYDKALEHFTALKHIAERKEVRTEARIGVLRCNVKLRYNKEIVKSAKDVLAIENVAEGLKREALFSKANANMQLGEEGLAMTDYKVLAKNTFTREGAEAKYKVIQFYYDQENSKLAEEEIFEFVKKGSSHQYWLARSFMVLADIYTDNQEYFQAKQYLTNVADNYKGDDDIKDLVAERMRVVNNLLNQGEEESGDADEQDATE